MLSKILGTASLKQTHRPFGIRDDHVRRADRKFTHNQL